MEAQQKDEYTAPQKIYLQVPPGETLEMWEGITWANDEINPTDAEYIHIDKYNELIRALKFVDRVATRDLKRGQSTTYLRNIQAKARLALNNRIF